MPHWLAALIAAATFLASWRWTFRPLVRFSREVRDLLRDIKANAAGVREVAHELHALAGSVVTMAVTMAGQHEQVATQVADNTQRLDGLAEEVVDLSREVRSVKRKIGLPLR